jgi:hypothetical protein
MPQGSLARSSRFRIFGQAMIFFRLWYMQTLADTIERSQTIHCRSGYLQENE